MPPGNADMNYNYIYNYLQLSLSLSLTRHSVHSQTPSRQVARSNILRGTVVISVTRLGDFLHFGQSFKDGGNNYFTQIDHIVIQFL